MSTVTTYHPTDLLRSILRHQLGIALPHEQVGDLWQACEQQLTYAGLGETLAHIQKNQPRQLGEIDTLERGDVLTSLAMVLTQKDWPSNAASIDRDDKLAFLIAMIDGMKARGYTPAIAEALSHEAVN